MGAQFVPPPHTFFFVNRILFSGLFLFLSLCWSESELDIVRVLMGYKWDTSSLCQTCWEIFNLIFFSCTHTFLYSFIFNIRLSRMYLFFLGLPVSANSLFFGSHASFLDLPLWASLLSSWVLRSWISWIPFETGSGTLSFPGRHLPPFQRRRSQVGCLWK